MKPVVVCTLIWSFGEIFEGVPWLLPPSLSLLLVISSLNLDTDMITYKEGCYLCWGCQPPMHGDGFKVWGPLQMSHSLCGLNLPSRKCRLLHSWWPNRIYWSGIRLVLVLHESLGNFFFFLSYPVFLHLVSCASLLTWYIYLSFCFHDCFSELKSFWCLIKVVQMA